MTDLVLKLRSAGRTAVGHLNAAKGLFQSGRFDAALTEIDAALAINPEVALAHFVRGLIYARRAEYEQAEDALELAVRLDATDASQWIALAYVQYEQGSHSAALASVDQGLAADPKHARGHLLRSNTLEALERRDEALAACREAVKYDPLLGPARCRLASLLSQAGKADEGIEHALVAGRINPADMNARVATGDLLRELGRLEEAIVEFRAAADLFPNRSPPKARLGDVYLQQGLTVDAQIMYRAAIQVDSKQVHCMVELGKTFLEQGSLNEAAELFRAALEIDDRLQEATDLLAQCEAKQAAV